LRDVTIKKEKKKFVCQECGYESMAWLGRCPGCQSWSTLTEEVIVQKRHDKRTASVTPQSISHLSIDSEKRFSTGMGELDRIVGGGIVPGSAILIGGDPGIGKSTLLLQISHKIALKNGPVLYVSGEESIKQTGLRARRLGLSNGELYFLSEVDLEAIEEQLCQMRPRVVVIDSIQTVSHPDLSAAPGSISQVRECAYSLTQLAKRNEIALFLIGHVTKDGAIAGPKVLEHIVDTVLYFEGEPRADLRILRVVKNRFGSTNEIGIFEMGERGLTEVENPSALFIAERLPKVSGSMVIPCMEGMRPLLVEVQALVSQGSFSMPRRLTNGIDYNRAGLLLSILEKRAGVHLQDKDVFINLAGGLKLSEPALDLGVAMAVVSSYRDIALPARMVAIGEVGLGGELRRVAHVAVRTKEASRLGFNQCILSKGSVKGVKKGIDIELIEVEEVKEALNIALKQ
jgi:DNA repair protein RadA/Sms